MKLIDILKGSDYSLDLFNDIDIKELEDSIIERVNKKETKDAYVKCIIRDNEIKLTPEEIVRQLYTKKLINEYGYKKEQISFEVVVKMGRSENKRADIIIYEDKTKLKPFIVVEVKQPKEQSGKEQLSGYCKTLGASIAVLCNGYDIEEFYLNKENPKNKTYHLEKLSYLPKSTQTLTDVLNVPYTLKNLILNDELQTKTLKKIILGFEDVVLANAGVDSFEEIFKFIFTKLYDEFLSRDDADAISTLINHTKIDIKDIDDTNFRQLEFRNTGTETEVSKRIASLFEKAKKEWSGIFEESENIKLMPSDIKICVSYLQDVKLFNSNLEVVDDAFEYLVNKQQKGDKGQYFTPRYVIDMCVKMLNPKESETMIDTAAGSCGFPMHTIFHVWKQLNPNSSNLFTTKTRSQRELNYVKEKVFAIDFDIKSVRVGRTLNLIAGDGHTNVLHLNTLDYNSWNQTTQDKAWLKSYNEGFNRLEELAVEKDDYSHFNFDILMANPPFAGDISKDTILSCYPNTSSKPNGKLQSKVGRDILFIERNLNCIKPGGRMAIVLPQGRFNNSSDKHIRDFLAEHCRILAVVGLHGNTFKPHTGTKTSVIFVQKWDEKLCPKKDDYNIFFATQQEPAKDNSGDKIYVKEDDGTLQRDAHGHIFVKHDLYNHEGLTQDGIAEAFIEFAKKEKLSFF